MKHYPGSDIKNFKEVLRISERIFKNIDCSVFFSPYSVVPIVAQLEGLYTSMLGSGDSIYSMISIASQIEKQYSLFRKLYLLPLEEKRKIIDEIYEMIAPLLLEEENEYINLLTSTKYYHTLKNFSQKDTIRFKSILQDKFAALRSFISPFCKRKGDFAHIAHYGYIKDLYKEYGFLSSLSRRLLNEWSKYSFPIVSEIIFKNFNAVDSSIKSEIKGWIIFVASSTQQLLTDSNLRRKKMLQSFLLAKKLGARIVGMGGLAASFTRGGRLILENIKDINFTTGHAYTIANIMGIINKCKDEFRVDIGKITVAVVGAAGSIGSGCVKLLVESGARNIVMIDTTNFISYRKLRELAGEIKKKQVRLCISTVLDDIKEADLIIIATNSPFSLIKATHLKPGAIVIDDSFPKNVSEKIIKQRKDVLFLEGGAVHFPLTIEVNVSRNMPDLMDAPLTRLISCKEGYSSFSETLILALTNYRGNYGVGSADPKLAEDIKLKADMIGISPALLGCFNRGIDKKKIAKILEIRKNQNGLF